MVVVLVECEGGRSVGGYLHVLNSLHNRFSLGADMRGDGQLY